MSTLVLQLEDEAAMVAAGGRFASVLEAGTSLFLSGELGAGKTTFTRGIVRGLGHSGAVKSPTYTLVEPYLELSKPLYHFDLYRLADPEELEFMGMRDYFDAGALLVLEWPERGGDFLPVPDLEISIAVASNSRIMTAIARSERGTACLSSLQA